MDLGTRIFRSLLLSLAGNKLAEKLAAKYGLKRGAQRFIAGRTLDEALARVRELNAQGIGVTLDHLGEGIRLTAEAAVYRDEYIRLVESIRGTNIQATVSLKPTQMGLKLDPENCYANIRDIVAAARSCSNFVTLDMEDTACTAATIGLVRRLRADGLSNVGTVIQAYLYRSEEDVERLTREGVTLRLVKGAYKEPRTLAYPRLTDVDANFLRLIKLRLDSGVYTAIATHDERIIDWTKRYADDCGITVDRFEFQMLYGIRSQSQKQLADEGYTVRCYVPYGRMWYPYFVRRLAERPANVMFIVKNRNRR
ncbi:proline dehydrogenase family protein [Cohnella panacarvi]|uniref:proline dehydrogenase family protein n=1 Tax=Cohnella panacarvi TaxID=400776 RepID=UPI00047B0B57|nr:proline dehydrogenase family protein [Cohnella panacarvi]